MAVFGEVVVVMATKPAGSEPEVVREGDYVVASAKTPPSPLDQSTGSGQLPAHRPLTPSPTLSVTIRKDFPLGHRLGDVHLSGALPTPGGITSVTEVGRQGARIDPVLTAISSALIHDKRGSAPPPAFRFAAK